MKALIPMLATGLLLGCSNSGERRDAAKDVRAFLHAARTGDAATFERYVDRPAVTRIYTDELRATSPGMVRSAERRGGLQAYVDGMISPYGFRQAMMRGGTRDRTPPEAEVAALLVVLDERRVCLPGASRDVCSMTFTRGADDTWRLTGLELEQSTSPFKKR